MGISEQKTLKRSPLSKTILSVLSLTIVLFIVGAVSVFSMFVSSVYLYTDAPAFRLNSPFFFLALAIAVFIFILIMHIGKRLSWNALIPFILFAALSMVVIALIPLEPFSDMKSVYDIAAADMADTTGYLSVYSNQIPITVYFWLLLKIFPTSVLTIKIANIIWGLVCLYLIYKCYGLLKKTSVHTGKILWFSCVFIPPLLYNNHLYSDVPATALSLIAVYLILKERKKKKDLVIICVSMALQYLIRPSGIIFIIAAALYLLIIKRHLLKTVVFVLITAVIILGANKINDSVFDYDKSGTSGYPVWSWVQMGINEEEFGFQDGTHSPDWTLEDCLEKYKALGPAKILKIYAKKEMWLWSEGTYQALRYSFGDAGAEYSYETPVTHRIRDTDGSALRKALDYLMKAQYLVMMFLAFIGFLRKRKDPRIILFTTSICGFFFFYLIWEMKSRYIYPLYPVFLLMAMFGWNYIVSKKRAKDRKKNEDDADSVHSSSVLQRGSGAPDNEHALS